jgi:O-antigen ligase
MKHLWLLLLPLFCLPDLLWAQETSVGVLKWTDYLIGPYLLSIWSAGGLRANTLTRPLTIVLWVFGIWALLSTLTISLRYGARADYAIRVGLVKLAKFGIYAIAGIGTLRVVNASAKVQEQLRWMVLAAVLTSAVSVYLSASMLEDLPTAPDDAGFRFEATNAVSVLMSMLLAFVLGEWAARTRFIAWRNAGVVVLPVVVMGFFLTGGRGGWIGLVLALAYILFRAGLRPSFVLGGAVLVLVGSLVYGQNESFSRHVDITLNPALLSQETEFAQATGFDDGNRFTIFLNESQKVIRAPLFGSGIFHRGGASGLFVTGSHNFFLQMFLEAGIVGGGAMLMFFRRMWLVSRGKLLPTARLQLGSQAALVAAVAGGLTGEYFYGGPVLLMLFVLVAPALSGDVVAQNLEAASLPLANQSPPTIRVQHHA